MRKRDVARYLMQHAPAVGGGSIPLDQFALVLLLECGGEWTVAQIRDALGVSQSTASGIVDRAVVDGRVSTERGRFDHRLTVVVLAPRSVREREVSRAAKRTGRAARKGPYRRGPLRDVVEDFGATVKLSCGHTLTLTSEDRRAAKRRHCADCLIEGRV